MQPKLHENKTLKLSDIPFAPSYEAGHLVTVNSGFRNERPLLNLDKCNGCNLCYLYCPDGCIKKTSDNKVAIDFDFCKGCGICQKICKKDAITMESEK